MYLRASNAAALIDLPLSTFYQLVRAGQLPPPVSKLGRTRLWRVEDIIAAVDPRGYKAKHEHQTATGGSQAGQAVGSGEVRLPPRSGYKSAREANPAARRSPYAGILGGPVCGKAVDFAIPGADADHRDG